MKVKKVFQKPLAILMVVCMLGSMLGAANSGISESSENYSFNFGETYITVSGNVDNQTAELIARIMNGEMMVTPYSACSHNMVHVASGTGTNHKQFATAPRCLEATYNIFQCSKCGYASLTKISERRVSCC